MALCPYFAQAGKALLFLAEATGRDGQGTSFLIQGRVSELQVLLPL